MGRRGPAAEPAPLKLLKGRGEGKDSAGRDVKLPPAFERAAPEPPEWLSEQARRQWELCAPTLERLDLVKPEDQAIFTAFCEAWALYVRLLGAVTDSPLVNVSESGVPHLNPGVKALSTAQNDLLRFAREFGLTPSAEQNLGKLPDRDEDDDDPFAG